MRKLYVKIKEKRRNNKHAGGSSWQNEWQALLAVYYTACAPWYLFSSLLSLLRSLKSLKIIIVKIVILRHHTFFFEFFSSSDLQELGIISPYFSKLFRSQCLNTGWEKSPRKKYNSNQSTMYYVTLPILLKFCFWNYS